MALTKTVLSFFGPDHDSNTATSEMFNDLTGITSTCIYLRLDAHEVVTVRGMRYIAQVYCYGL